MIRIWLVAANTLRETLRKRLYLNIAVFGVGMVLFAMVVGNVTFGYTDRVVRSIGLSGVTIAVDLMALLVGVGLVHREIEAKTLFAVLTRPIRRWQYILGRFLGLMLAVFTALIGFSLVFGLVLFAVDGEPSTKDVIAIAASLPEAAVLGALGLVLSSFSTPTVSAGVGLGVWIAGAVVDDFIRLTESASGGLRFLAQVAYHALPALERFNFREAAVYALPVSASEVFGAFVYGFAYVGFLLSLASLILVRREMV